MTSASYEKSFFDKQHDHLVIHKRKVQRNCRNGKFADPRIQGIKDSIEEIFGVKIENHSLYFYGHKKHNEANYTRTNVLRPHWLSRESLYNTIGKRCVF